MKVDLLLPLVVLFTLGCEPQPSMPKRADGPPVVCAVNYPLYYFAKRLAGSEARVVFPVPAHVDPAFWRPNDDAIRTMQSADLVLLNGARYSKWRQTVSLSSSNTVNTSASFGDRLIKIQDAVTHRHAGGGEHSHEGTAFVTWLDPTLALCQAEAVHGALGELLPDVRGLLAERFRALKQDLLELDAKFESIATAHRGKLLFASHPVYQYWARRYGWSVRSVVWEPHVVPTRKQFEKLTGFARDHAARWMLWEAPPQSATVKQLEARGIAVVVFYHCGNRPAETDFLGVMHDNADRLAMALAQ